MPRVMKKARNIALLLISCAWLLTFVGRITPSTLLVQIVNSVGITDIEAGIALSSMWLLYGIMQYPGGAWSDVQGRKRIIVISLVCFTFASFFMAINWNFLSVLLTFSFMGFAAGILPAPSFTMIAELFGPRKGQALGIHSSIGSLSGLAPVILPFIAYSIGWRSVFLIWGVFGVILTILFLFYVKETLIEPVKQRQSAQLKMGLQAFFEKDTLFMFIINIVITFAWMGLLSWFPTYIQQVKGFSPEIAGILFSIMLSGSLLFKPIIGRLSDKMNHLFIMGLLTLMAGVSLFFLTIETSLVGLIIATFVFSQTGAFYPVRTSYLMDLWEKKTAGTKIGIFRSLIVLIGSPVAGIIGWSKGLYGFNAIFLLMAIGLFITACSLFIYLGFMAKINHNTK